MGRSDMLATKTTISIPCCKAISAELVSSVYTEGIGVASAGRLIISSPPSQKLRLKIYALDNSGNIEKPFFPNDIVLSNAIPVNFVKKIEFIGLSGINGNFTLVVQKVSEGSAGEYADLVKNITGIRTFIYKFIIV